MSLLALLRPDIRTMTPYRSAQFVDGLVRLNANESPWRPPGDASDAGLNRYPEPRPQRLTLALSQHYAIAPERLLVTRGSSEAIDVITRGFCRAGVDEIVICPPTFGMYETYAQIQGAKIRRVPLLRDHGFAIDTAAVLDQWNANSRVLFVCSPNNPTASSVPLAQLRELAAGLRDRGVLVLDAAYVEFAAEDPSRTLLDEFDNVIVLRTLSKAMSLAGARCGVMMGPAEVIAALSCVLPPYTFPTISAEAVNRCLDPANDAEWQRRFTLIRAERTRLMRELARNPRIRQVWPSDANYILMETTDAAAALAAARAGGVLVRDFSWYPDLPNCIRITVGDPRENDQVLEALSA